MKIFTYTIKCRNCGAKTLLSVSFEKKSTFEYLMDDKSVRPISSSCQCDLESLMLHDLISYSL